MSRHMPPARTRAHAHVQARAAALPAALALRIGGVLIALALLLAALPARAEIQIQEVKSQGGITAWLVEDHTIPFAALQLSFRGGASLDAADKAGATSLMAALLEEGAGDLDARAFARAQESLAASFGYSVGDDSVSISAKFLTENRDAALELLRKTLIEPRFDEDAIERVRAQMLSNIRSDLKDPNAIAGQAFSKLAFGDHPYANPQDGTEATVGALTRDDLLAAKQAALVLGRVSIGVVGDITPEELAPLLDALLGDLPQDGPPLPPRATVQLTGGTTVIEFATPQSVALFGHEGLALDDEDFFAAYLLNTILGGGSFESRLMTEVREKRGLTYGVYSYLVGKEEADIWMGQVASANDRIGEAISVIRAQWAHIAEEGVTQEELDNAKTYLTGSYPLRFDGNGPIARIITGMQENGFPIDYAATRNEKVEAVTLEDVNRVARERLRAQDLRFVVVGQPEGLEAN